MKWVGGRGGEDKDYATFVSGHTFASCLQAITKERARFSLQIPGYVRALRPALDFLVSFEKAISSLSQSHPRSGMSCLGQRPVPPHLDEGNKIDKPDAGSGPWRRHGDALQRLVTFNMFMLARHMPERASCTGRRGVEAWRRRLGVRNWNLIHLMVTR